MADDLDDVADETSESSEALIAVHWREEGYYPPPAKFTAQANASDPAIREQFTEDKFPDCFTAYADLLTWNKKWDTVLNTSSAPFWKWFVGGELNASYNCVDRHMETHPNKAALIWVPEPESEAHQAITYRELYVRVNEMAALLRFDHASATKPCGNGVGVSEEKRSHEIKILAACLICPCVAETSAADTLRLTNGQIIYGQFIGRTAQGVQFILENGNPQTFPSDQAASIFGPIPASSSHRRNLHRW